MDMSIGRPRRPLAVAGWMLALACLVPRVSAGDTGSDTPGIDAAAAREFPTAMFDTILEEIARQTRFVLTTPDGLVRWWSQTAQLTDFVKSPSHEEPDTYLYAMRYLVPILTDGDTTSVYRTSCQVVVVYKRGAYQDPLVVCEPVRLDRQGAAL